MLDDDRLRAAVALLDKRFGLAALYLFGSHAKGTATASSDVDLAALFSRPVPALDRVRVIGDLVAVLGRYVDLVDLRDASPIVAMQVLRYGHLVHEGDRRARVAFEASVPGRYEDIVRIRQPQVDALFAWMTDGRS